MRPDRVREGRRWLDQAIRDLDDARFCIGGQRFSLGCFVAQQAAEKALKRCELLVAKVDITPACSRQRKPLWHRASNGTAAAADAER